MNREKIKTLYSELSPEDQASLLFELYVSLKPVSGYGEETDTSIISKYAERHQQEYGKAITFDVEKKEGSNLIGVTLHTVYGKFKGLGTNQKIAKINAVKLADDCWGNN